MASSSSGTRSGTPAPRARRKYAARMPLEQRRDQLLDAALTVLLRDGYGGLNIDAIARQAVVTRPVVYSAFGDLPTLLDELLDRTQHRALSTVVDLVGATATDDVGEWVIAVISAFLEAVGREPDVWRPVLGLVHGAPRDVQVRIDSTREFIRAEIEQNLADRLEDRGPRIDVGVLSHVLRVTAEQFARLALTDPQQYSTHRLVAGVRPLLAPLRPMAD